MTTGTREMRFLLAEPEGRILRALATRVPRSIRSNHLTAIGLIGAAGAGTAYALTTYNPAWLWVASAMLVLNWLGDSLDGTLARVRGTQRPKYGYYLDHVVDAFSRSEEHTSELQSQSNLVCRLLLEKKKKRKNNI